MEVKKAGCIVLDLVNEKIALVYREMQKDYSFSKGHLENNETLEECAIRETEEETGRKCEIVNLKNKLPVLSYIDSNGDKTDTYYYIAIDMGKSEKNFKEDLIHKIVWKQLGEVKKTLTYDNLKQFWDEVEGMVKEVLKNEKN